MSSTRLLLAVAVASGCAPLATDEQSQALTGSDGGGNRPPVAEDDTATTEIDTPVDFFILANDNPNGGWLDPASIAVSNGPWYGTVDVDASDGMTTYTPNPGYRGSDVFGYQVCNADARCSSAYVFVFVDPAAPVVARADQLPTLYWYETPTPLPILDNDLTPGVWVVTTALVPPAHGDFYTDWTVHYNPYPDYTGPDELIYQVCTDAGCAASLARMSARVNHPPTIVPDHVITDEDNPIVFNALANDTDPDGDPLHMPWPCYEGPDWWFFRGQLSCSLDGTCYFSPAPQEFGEVSVVCDVCDIADYCVTEEVPLTVLHVPNPPECYDDAVTTVEDTPVEFRVVLNDAFNGGRPWFPTMFFDPEPAHATWAIDEDFGITTYTPHANYTGSDSFAYTLCDIYGLCCSAAVNVTITPGDNDPPAYTPDATNTAQTIRKTGVPVPLRATDPDDAVLTFDRVSGTLPDGISLRSDGTFATSRRHRRGTYLSTIRVSDPAGQSASTTLAITVD